MGVGHSNGEKCIKDSMRVQARETEGHHVIAEVEGGAESRSIYFKSDNLPLRLGGDALVAMSLLPAMKVGKDLVLNAKASRRLLSSLDTIQDIYTAWHPNLHRIEIKGATSAQRESRVQGAACFFSGGIDSFYTFLQHREEVTHLVFIYHFDGVQEEIDLINQKIDAIRRVASEFGKRAVVVETNLRAFLEPHVPWNMLGHGAMLFTVGHLLSRHFARIYIPATHTYADLSPLATHPLLDPLWSGEGMNYIHDGAESDRIQKAKFISDYDIVMETLRVCFMNHNGSYNCGRCEKCIRTMINLKIAGVLDRCDTFKGGLRIENVRNINAKTENKIEFVRQNLEALEELGRYPEIQDALRYVLRRYTKDGVRGVVNKVRMKAEGLVEEGKYRLKNKLRGWV